MLVGRLKSMVAILAMATQVEGGAGCSGHVVGMDPEPQDAAPAVGRDAAVDAAVEIPDGAVRPACEGDAIYVITEWDMLRRYDPAARTFYDVGELRCQPDALPFSMAVSRDGMAYVLYYEAGSSPLRGQCRGLFLADTATGACLGQTSYACVNAAGFTLFGMGFADGGPDPRGETLYIVGPSPGETSLGWIDTATWEPHAIAPLSANEDSAELTAIAGSGLWAFFGYASPPFVARVDPTSGMLSDELTIPTELGQSAHALAAWGGEGYAFYSTSTEGEIWRITPGAVTLHDGLGEVIVGAGNAPCPEATSRNAGPAGFAGSAGAGFAGSAGAWFTGSTGFEGLAEPAGLAGPAGFEP